MSAGTLRAAKQTRASAAQRRAADPAASVWVAASAGTGKTTVLTGRVLSLMIAGAPPERLLCLTFTKAAAAEVANRIADRLGQWATCAEAVLRDDYLERQRHEGDSVLLGHLIVRATVGARQQGSEFGQFV